MSLGAHQGRRVLDDLEIDDSDSPAIALVPPGVSWEEVRDHIKIAHHPLLVPPPPIEGTIFNQRTQVPLARGKVRHVGLI